MTEINRIAEATTTPEIVADQEARRELSNTLAWYQEAFTEILPTTPIEHVAELIARTKEVVLAYSAYCDETYNPPSPLTHREYSELTAELHTFTIEMSDALLRYIDTSTTQLAKNGTALLYDTLIQYHSIITSNPDIAHYNAVIHSDIILNQALLKDAPLSWHKTVYEHATQLIMPTIVPRHTTSKSLGDHLIQQLEAIDILSQAWTTDDQAIGYALSDSFQPMFGRRTNDIFNAWDTCTAHELNTDQTPEERKALMASFMKQNLEMIMDIWLDVGTDGIAKLSDTYGIRHFGRYTADLLTAQAQHVAEEQPAKNYIVVLYPFADHNGAFYQQQDVFESLHEQLADTHHVVIAESAHRRELLKRLTLAHREYGGEDGAPADMVVLGAHGSPRSMTFDQSIPAHRLTTQNLMQSTPPPGIDRAIRKEAPIVLVSCSTGIDGGIAERAAQTLGRPIIAPDAPTNIVDIDIVVDDTGHIDHAYPTYNNSKARIFHSSTTESKN